MAAADVEEEDGGGKGSGFEFIVRRGARPFAFADVGLQCLLKTISERTGETRRSLEILFVTISPEQWTIDCMFRI